MNKQILKLLKKILPELIKSPKLMFGHNTTSEEIDYVTENRDLVIEK
jgi:hypothetical protein